MQQKTQRKAVCCHDSQYKPFSGLERCLFGSWEPQVMAQAFVEESQWMPKQFQQQQSENLALATPAREWVYVPQHQPMICLKSLSPQKKKEKALLYTSSRIGSWPANR